MTRLEYRRRTRQAAKSFGEVHVTIEPKISELFRKEVVPWELKHLSTGRKRKQ